MRYAVDKDVPVQREFSTLATRRRRSRVPYYPFDEMGVGDSFLVPEEDLSLNPNATIRGAVNNYLRVSGLDRGFICRRRRLASEGEDGIRVWRVR